MWTAVFLNFTQNSGNCRAAKAKGERANGAAFLLEPGSDGLEQGRVTQEIPFASAANLGGQMIRVERASPEP